MLFDGFKFPAQTRTRKSFRKNGVKNGRIVCRVTLSNPGRMDDCIPLNIFGADRASAAAVEYSFGLSPQFDAITEKVGVNNQKTVYKVWAAKPGAYPQ